MRTFFFLLVISFFTLNTYANDLGMKKGTPIIKSISSLEFNYQGILFIGDSKNAHVVAINLKDNLKNDKINRLEIPDIEKDLAELLGTSKDNILIHDLAVNPISQNIYISVSRGRAKWSHKWHRPNDVEDATILIKVSPTGEYSEVSLEDVDFSSVDLVNPVSSEKIHRWKEGKIPLRVDAITDLVYSKGKIYITGLSNEIFSSSIWITPFPFNDNVTLRSVEIYHGAHGKWETHAPIRTFLPYSSKDKDYLLAAYLCTPIVVLDLKSLEEENHVKGRTIAEFGSGNYPTDMVLYKNNNRDYIVMSNSQLPLSVFALDEVTNFKGEIVDKVNGYSEGLDYTAKSGTGIQQISDFNSRFIIATKRRQNGKLALVSISKSLLKT